VMIWPPHWPTRSTLPAPQKGQLGGAFTASSAA
jgi:hypothetical protein